MRDVARVADVSQTTVSFVINDVPDAHIPQTTRGLPFDQSLVRSCRAVQGGGYQATRALLGVDDPPTALLCFNDQIAMGAYQALFDGDLDVPGDAAVVGFDDHELIAPCPRPALSTIAVPHYEMRRWAVEHLLELIDGSTPDRDTPAVRAPQPAGSTPTTTASGSPASGTHRIIAEPEGTMYQTLEQSQAGPIIYAFRDPFAFRDPADGQSYLLFEGNSGGEAGTHVCGERERRPVPPGHEVPADSRFYTGIAVADPRPGASSSRAVVRKAPRRPTRARSRRTGGRDRTRRRRAATPSRRPRA